MAYAYIKEKSPPSTYAIADWVEGKPGSMKRVTELTAKRVAFIWPGVLVYSLMFDRKMGIGKQIILSAFVSYSITGGLYLYYRNRRS